MSTRTQESQELQYVKVDDHSFKYELPEGTVYVEICKAYRDDRNYQKEEFPVLMVSTTPDGNLYRGQERGKVKLRGREYSFTEHWQRVPFERGWLPANHSYGGGQRDAAGGDLDWKSPMRGRLHELAERVRVAFVAEFGPRWERMSIRRLMEADVIKARGEVDDLERKLRTEQARVAALMSRLNAFDRKNGS